MLFILMAVPETPRWLASHDRADESLIVLQRLNQHRMSDETIRLLHADIVATVEAEKAAGTGSWRDLAKNDDFQSRRRFLIACAVQCFQQLGGINAIIYVSLNRQRLCGVAVLEPTEEALMADIWKEWSADFGVVCKYYFPGKRRI